MSGVRHKALVLHVTAQHTNICIAWLLAKGAYLVHEHPSATLICVPNMLITEVFITKWRKPEGGAKIVRKSGSQIANF